MNEITVTWTFGGTTAVILVVGLFLLRIALGMIAERYLTAIMEVGCRWFGRSSEIVVLYVAIRLCPNPDRRRYADMWTSDIFEAREAGEPLRRRLPAALGFIRVAVANRRAGNGSSASPRGEHIRRTVGDGLGISDSVEARRSFPQIVHVGIAEETDTALPIIPKQ